LARGAGGAISEGMTDLLEIALRNLDRLIRLVDDLLDLSRIESGRVAMNLTSVTLAEAVQRAVDAVEAFARDREMRIELEESDPDVAVTADADRLQQVIVNLISNAVKFSPVNGRVGLRWWVDDGHAVLRITDEGPGIPAQQLETIFDKFRQLEQSATRKYGGAGLGLAISRTIMKELGGALWAESEEGEGSQFFVKLRLATPKAIVVPEAAPLAEGVRSVLLVERDGDLRRLFRAQFEADGWEVIVAESGAAALGETERDGFGLVVVGVELGDMHGLEFLRQLRSSPASVDLPALLVGPGGEASRAVAYGADGWMEGDADQLTAEAERLLGRPRRRVVLLIEDDPAVRTGLARGLRLAGFACLEAASGEVAVGLARARVPDIVLTDVQVPGKDGLEVLRDFRADPKLANVPAIVVTGHATPETLKAIGSLKASFLSKPFGVKTVLEEVRRMVGPSAAAN
jgi:DNA-binding response OmpR family regulator